MAGMRGRSINIYLPDSNPRGVKICEIQDSIVKAIYSPRSLLDLAFKRPELLDPGIYFLIGRDDELSKPEIYIGEAESLITRIKQHNSTKDFWNLVISFVSEKKNINKAHIKFLESYACEQALIASRSKLQNSILPKLPTLTEQDRDFALGFFDDIKIILATLGFPIFEQAHKKQEDRFFCKTKDIKAEGEYTEDGMIVFKNSEAKIAEASGLSQGIKDLRESLALQKILMLEDDRYIFTEDYLFNSPSAAAATILARSSNGWAEWKDGNNKTLDERFRKELQSPHPANI
jgi:hypothetical protein